MTADDLLKGGSADDMLKTPKPAPSKPEHPWQAVNRAARDPGATIPGSENLPHPAALLAETGAMLVAPGLPMAGRVAASGVASGIDAATKGGDPVKRGLVGAGIAALFEGILSGVTHAKIPKMTSSLSDLAGRVTGRRGQFKRATDAVDQAFDAIKDRLPAPGTKFLYVPAISAKKISAEEAREGLKKLEGSAYDAARKQIHAELLEMDKRAGKSAAIGQNLYTAKDFGSRTLKERFTPPSSGAERMAEQAVNTLGHPTTRAAADVASTTDVGGLPAGAILPLSVMGHGGDLKGFLRHLR